MKEIFVFDWVECFYFCKRRIRVDDDTKMMNVDDEYCRRERECDVKMLIVCGMVKQMTTIMAINLLLFLIHLHC